MHIEFLEVVEFRATLAHEIARPGCARACPQVCPFLQVSRQAVFTYKLFEALAHIVPHPILARFKVDRFHVAYTLPLPFESLFASVYVRAMIELRRDTRSG